MDTPSKSLFSLIFNFVLALLMIGTAGAFPFVQMRYLVLFSDFNVSLPMLSQTILQLPGTIPLGISILLICLLVANDRAPIPKAMQWLVRGIVLLTVLGFWMVVTLAIYVPLQNVIEAME